MEGRHLTLLTHCSELENSLRIQTETSAIQRSEMNTSLPPDGVSVHRESVTTQTEHLPSAPIVSSTDSGTINSADATRVADTSLSAMHQDLKQSHEELCQTYSQLTWDHDELQRLYQRESQEFTELSDVHTELSQAHDDISQNHGSLVKQHEQLNQNYTRLSQAHQELSRTHLDVSSVQDELVKRQQRAERQHQELEGEQQEAQSIIRQLTEKVEDLEAALAAEKLSVKDARKQVGLMLNYVTMLCRKQINNIH